MWRYLWVCLTLFAVVGDAWVVAQVIPQAGAHDVGFESFDAYPDEDTEMRTVVWYPTVVGAVGTSAFIHGEIGGTSHHSRALRTRTKLRRTDHFRSSYCLMGRVPWGGQFTYLGESLASHGYVVTAPYHSEK